MTTRALEIIGLLPAGGQATRLAPLPLSKELYPIGFQAIDSQDSTADSLRPKVVAHYLLEKMRQSGISRAFFILRPGKWDIPAYFGDGAMLDLPLGYLTVHTSDGVPYTIDQAYPFVQNAIVALGFPDVLFQPEDGYLRLIDRQAQTGADVVLGLFPAHDSQKVGMVDFDAAGCVLQIIEKPPQTDLRYMWAIALWTPTFTQFLHDRLKTVKKRFQQELPMGDVIQAAIDANLRVEAVAFTEGSYLDIGTPADLKRALQQLTR